MNRLLEGDLELRREQERWMEFERADRMKMDKMRRGSLCRSRRADYFYSEMNKRIRFLLQLLPRSS